MPDTIEKPSEIDAKAEEVKPSDAELAAEEKAKADRADAAETAYQESLKAQQEKSASAADTAEAAFQADVEKWFHEVGRTVGIAFPSYSDYETSE